MRKKMNKTQKNLNSGDYICYIIWWVERNWSSRYAWRGFRRQVLLSTLESALLSFADPFRWNCRSRSWILCNDVIWNRVPKKMFSCDSDRLNMSPAKSVSPNFKEMIKKEARKEVEEKGETQKPQRDNGKNVTVSTHSTDRVSVRW